MSSLVQIPPPATKLALLPIDQGRGLGAVWAVIATEATLFVCMFGAYYYLGNNKDRWALQQPPHLVYPFVLLAVLLSSSVVLHWGERQVEKERYRAGRIALWFSVLLGLTFLVLQGFEYASEWSDLTPDSNSYGSIFYTITSLHGAHVIVGVLILMYVGCQPFYGFARRSPHMPYQVASRYWHFVDAVWVFIVALLYVIPNIQRHLHVH
ncbi:MAG TPA: cytochrome c oxidase subunit 3 [Terracidiphilus sp.]|nr:cytochrome c oxidase subunit 3 [Terracidiphilus sp.]